MSEKLYEGLRGQERISKFISNNPELPFSAIGDEIGSGGFGCVYEVKLKDKYIEKKLYSGMDYLDEDTKKEIRYKNEYVVKIIDIRAIFEKFYGNTRKEANYESFSSRQKLEFENFERIKKSSEKVSFKNLVPILDYNIIPRKDYEFSNKVSDIHFILMPKMKGTLTNVFNQIQPIDELYIINIGLQCLAGLKILHKCQIVHRDLKPENILYIQNMDDVSIFKISDFGCSRKLDENREDGTTLLNLASDFYKAPETEGRHRNFSVVSDIYSIGGILCRICIGEDISVEIANKVLAPEKPANISIDLWNVIMKAWDSDPKERFQNTNEFIQALTEINDKIYKLTDKYKLQVLQDEFTSKQDECKELRAFIEAHEKQWLEIKDIKKGLQVSEEKYKFQKERNEELVNNQLSDELLEIFMKKSGLEYNENLIEDKNENLIEDKNKLMEKVLCLERTNYAERWTGWYLHVGKGEVPFVESNIWDIPSKRLSIYMHLTQNYEFKYFLHDLIGESGHYNEIDAYPAKKILMRNICGKLYVFFQAEDILGHIRIVTLTDDKDGKWIGYEFERESILNQCININPKGTPKNKITFWLLFGISNIFYFVEKNGYIVTMCIAIQLFLIYRSLGYMDAFSRCALEKSYRFIDYLDRCFYLVWICLLFSITIMHYSNIYSKISLLSNITIYLHVCLSCVLLSLSIDYSRNETESFFKFISNTHDDIGFATMISSIIGLLIGEYLLDVYVQSSLISFINGLNWLPNNDFVKELLIFILLLVVLFIVGFLVAFIICAILDIMDSIKK